MLDLVLDSTDLRIAEEANALTLLLYVCLQSSELMVKLAEEMMEAITLNFYDAVMEASNKILDEVVKSDSPPYANNARNLAAMKPPTLP